MVEVPIVILIGFGSGGSMQLRVIETCIYLDVGRFTISFGFYPEAIFHFELNPTMEILVLSLLGIDFRITWSGEKGNEVAKEALKQVKRELDK